MINILKSFYQQYQLVTCLTIFEPWERKLINAAVILILAMIAFSCYVYLPKYLETVMYFLSPDSSDNLRYVPSTQSYVVLAQKM